MVKTVIFDGRARAKQDLERLAAKVKLLAQPPEIVSFFCPDDRGSALYTRMKAAKAQEVGIKFVAEPFKFDDDLQVIVQRIKKAASEKDAIGIITQKPTKNSYFEYFLSTTGKEPDLPFEQWWEQLVAAVPEKNDIDGLTPTVQAKLERGEKVKVLPATVQAVLKVTENLDLQRLKVLIIGQSDLLGQPLFWYWRAQGIAVELIGQQALEQKLASPEQLKPYELIVSATGVPKLIKGAMIAEGVALIDVGEPQADVEVESCLGKASLITPVPGGIGPLTIVSLLENSLLLR